MSTLSKIEWTDRTWNVVRGCSIVSPGCTNCYAMTQAHRFDFPHGPYEGLTRMTEHGAVWSGKIRLMPEALEEPLRWRKPARVFVNSMSDLFHEDVPDEFLVATFGAMFLAPQHTYQILTKRPERMRAFLSEADRWRRSPHANIWLGVSVENQATADERIPILLQTSAAVRFLSVEPLLGPVDLSCIELPSQYNLTPTCPGRIDCLRTGNDDRFYNSHRTIDWVIVGGESGRHARPCNIEWIRSIVAQCKAAGVPCFVKQLGAHPCEPNRWEGQSFHHSHDLAGEHLLCKKLADGKGGKPAEWPEDLRVREFPKGVNDGESGLAVPRRA